MESLLKPFFPTVDLPPVPEDVPSIWPQSIERCLECGQAFWVAGAVRIPDSRRQYLTDEPAAFIMTFLMYKHGWLSGWHALFNHPDYPLPYPIRTDAGSFTPQDLPLPDLAIFGVGPLDETFLYRDLRPGAFKEKVQSLLPWVSFGPVRSSDPFQ